MLVLPYSERSPRNKDASVVLDTPAEADAFHSFVPFWALDLRKQIKKATEANDVSSKWTPHPLNVSEFVLGRIEHKMRSHPEKAGTVALSASVVIEHVPGLNPQPLAADSVERMADVIHLHRITGEEATVRKVMANNGFQRNTV
jgi:hypothetical protein